MNTEDLLPNKKKCAVRLQQHACRTMHIDTTTPVGACCLLCGDNVWSSTQARRGLAFVYLGRWKVHWSRGVWENYQVFKHRVVTVQIFIRKSVLIGPQ